MKAAARYFGGRQNFLSRKSAHAYAGKKKRISGARSSPCGNVLSAVQGMALRPGTLTVI
ncbi:MAG TPA: hypothetical protein VN366_13195 [Feifaniaceae bacterium]|nr:hypothetical protein [Feifaniaceae bacterium]